MNLEDYVAASGSIVQGVQAVAGTLRANAVAAHADGIIRDDDLQYIEQAYARAMQLSTDLYALLDERVLDGIDETVAELREVTERMQAERERIGSIVRAVNCALDIVVISGSLAVFLQAPNVASGKAVADAIRQLVEGLP